ncbi:MAG: TatD family hydrolase [Spirochaetia bacterium]|nr:TatD family hydrolase [Spirochaetia bacterium]
MLTDAHFHADDLFVLDPGFIQEYKESGVVGLASVHSEAGLQATEHIMATAGPYLLSFGIHPQLAIMDEADALERLAKAGGLTAIGECGFDFFGDRPALVRTPENEKTQRIAFEFQLEVAERHGLPLVLHMRRANDLLFEYAKRLSRLRAVILHSWPGPANEARDFLARCPDALFSFGLSIVNGNKKAISSAISLPLSALLTETDAPYQPPRGLPHPTTGGHRRPLLRSCSTTSDLNAVINELARLRGQEPDGMRSYVNENFMRIFGDALKR